MKLKGQKNIVYLYGEKSQSNWINYKLIFLFFIIEFKLVLQPRGSEQYWPDKQATTKPIYWSICITQQESDKEVFTHIDLFINWLLNSDM